MAREPYALPRADFPRVGVWIGGVTRVSEMWHRKGCILPDVRTLSGVTRRSEAESSGMLSAGSLRIETFEGSRSRLRRTRAAMGIESDFDGGEWRDRPCWLCWEGNRVIGQPVSLTTWKAESDPERAGHTRSARVRSKRKVSLMVSYEVSELLVLVNSQWICWAVSRSTKAIAPPQCGHSQMAREVEVRLLFDLAWRGTRLQQLAAQWQQVRAAAIGQEAAEANAHEAAGQNVEQKPTQELLGGRGSSAAACCHGHSLSSGR